MSFMTFNKETADRAGATRFETGAHVGIMQCHHIVAKTGTKGLEFSLHGATDIDFITTYYEKEDGTPIKGGQAFVQAIMGILKLREINIDTINDIHTGEKTHIVREFCNHPIGMILQKVLYTKQDGADGYKVELVMPFHDKTRQTFAELASNKQASTVEKIIETLVDKDERKKGANTANNSTGNYDYNANSQQQGGFNQGGANQDSGFNQGQQGNGFNQGQDNNNQSVQNVPDNEFGGYF